MRYLTLILVLAAVSCTTGKQESNFYKDHFLPLDIETHNLVDFVNPLVGTESTFKLSNGNTYPHSCYNAVEALSYICHW